MVQVLVILTAGDQPLALSQFIRLDECRTVVGGWVEPIDLRDLGTTIYTNDEGRIRKHPHNLRISFPLSSNRVGDTTDVPEHVKELLLTAASFAIGMRTNSQR